MDRTNNDYRKNDIVGTHRIDIICLAIIVHI